MSTILSPSSWYTWITEHPFELLATNNFTAVLLMFAFVCVLGLYLLQNYHKISFDLKLMTFGVIIEQLGWIIQRSYYGIINLYRSSGDFELIRFLAEMKIIPIFSGSLIITGLGLILAPAATYFTGDHTRKTNWMGMLFFVFAVWWFIYFKVDQNVQSEPTPPTVIQTP